MTLTTYQFITPYSFLMALLWSSLFILISLLLRKFKVSIRYSVFPLIFLLFLSIVRLLTTIEVPGAIIVPAGAAYGDILVFLQKPLIEATFMGLSISLGNILLLLWAVVSIFLFIRYFTNYHKNQKIMKTLAITRDSHSEQLLKEISGIDTLKIRVFVILQKLKCRCLLAYFTPQFICPS